VSVLKRAYGVVELKEFDDNKREFEGIATTISTDRYGDIVESSGAVFELPLPLLWQHNASAPVGHVTSATPTKKHIKVKGNLAKTEVAGNLKDRLDDAWQSLKLGLVRHLSIGFNPIKYEPVPESDKYGLHFLEWEWLELSFVTIPANAGAGITAIKSLNALNAEQLRVLREYDRNLMRAASGKSGGNGAVRLDEYFKPGVTGVDKSKSGQRKRAVSLKVN